MQVFASFKFENTIDITMQHQIDIIFYRDID